MASQGQERSILLFLFHLWPKIQLPDLSLSFVYVIKKRELDYSGIIMQLLILSSKIIFMVGGRQDWVQVGLLLGDVIEATRIKILMSVFDTTAPL